MDTMTITSISLSMVYCEQCKKCNCYKAAVHMQLQAAQAQQHQLRTDDTEIDDTNKVVEGVMLQAHQAWQQQLS